MDFNNFRAMINGARHQDEYVTLSPDDAEALVKDRDGAYRERNALVCALSKLLPSWLERHPESDTEWEDDWRWIVFIVSPETSQMTWHIHDSELPNFAHLYREPGHSWDEHTTEEKYERLTKLIPTYP